MLESCVPLQEEHGPCAVKAAEGGSGCQKSRWNSPPKISRRIGKFCRGATRQLTLRVFGKGISSPSNSTGFAVPIKVTNYGTYLRYLPTYITLLFFLVRSIERGGIGVTVSK